MQWLRHLPFGLHTNVRSFLHDADPRSKLIFAAVYLSLVACSNDGIDLLLYGFVAFVFILASRLPFVYLWNGLKGLFPLLLVLAFYHLLLNSGGRIFISLGIFHIYYEGIAAALIIPGRLVLFIVTASLFSLTTPPAKLADGLEFILSPLRFLRIPVSHFVLMITVAFRYIPLFIDDMDAILKSQKLRSARLERAFWIKIRFLPQLLVVMCTAAFRRADQLALAMNARCYIPENTIRASRLHFGWRDWIIVCSAAVLLIVRIRLKGAVVEW